MEWDFEDFLEEVKFQMTEYDSLDEKKILAWEKKARIWVKTHKDKKYIRYKSEDDILIWLQSEDVTVMEEIARLFYKAVKNQTEEEYWKKFQLL